MSPQLKGGGHTGFGVDPVGVGGLCSFFSGHYLLNQWVVFDQTCIDTLFEGGGRVDLKFGL